ncbi:diaboline synthase-like, partial [Rutidosis leptorrhynchoides]|uniref:diaboline synthase-like n=1 Tax=Rutidosis leptorrhynchoides TaxID=125765 RepID=UPI003A98D569
TIISQETIKPSSPTPHNLKTHHLSILDQFSPNINMFHVFFYKNYNRNDTEFLKQSLSKSLIHYYPFAGRLPSRASSYIDCNDEGIVFFETSNDKKFDDVILSIEKGKFVCRSFVFSNKKLKELEKKVVDMGTTPSNPTRVELVTSLVFKCVVHAITLNTGCVKPSTLLHTVNMRNRIIKNCNEMPAGNIMTVVAANMAGSSEIKLNEVVGELRKAKMEVEGLKDIKEVFNHYQEIILNLGDVETRSQNEVSDVVNAKVWWKVRKEDRSRQFGCVYVIFFPRHDDQIDERSSSLCRSSIYNVDFGWGKPKKVIVRNLDTDKNGFILLDTPYGDGHLRKGCRASCLW